MGVSDIIGSVNNTNSTANSTETLSVLIQPDLAMLIYGIWGCVQFLVAILSIYYSNSYYNFVPAGGITRTLYNWVWLSGFIGFLIAWTPVAILWPFTYYYTQSITLTEVFLYTALVSFDGPALFYFFPLIMLLVCKTQGYRSGLIIASPVQYWLGFLSIVNYIAASLVSMYFLIPGIRLWHDIRISNIKNPTQSTSVVAPPTTNTTPAPTTVNSINTDPNYV